MTSLITQTEIDKFQVQIDLLEKALRQHVILPIGKVHVPKGPISADSNSGYTDAANVGVGNIILTVVISSTTFYVPGRWMT